MKKVMSVVGARPQFVKAAIVSKALQESGKFIEQIIHTGQHYDANMSDLFFDELEIPRPAYSLNVGSGSHGWQTGQMLGKIEEILLAGKPDVVLVYGDTNSTLAGTLAAVKLHIPVAHVEAGLRSFNRAMPEEINRVLTDHASSLLFAPTQDSVENLKKEGVSPDKVHLSGDVMYDVSLFFGEKAEGSSKILNRLSLEKGQYILSTVHRAENTDNFARLEAILGGLAEVAKETEVVLPLHPRTKTKIASQPDLQMKLENLKVIEPVGYLDMLMLEKNAQLVATDSGGVQKEAFFFGVPCVTLRDETEWKELISLGWNCLVSPKLGQGEVARLIRSRLGVIGDKALPYGHGDAAKKITDALDGISFS